MQWVHSKVAIIVTQYSYSACKIPAVNVSSIEGFGAMMNVKMLISYYFMII